MATDQLKLFVGGISRETSEESLKQHFNKYGNLLYSVISKDRFTGNPRGFGFVSFSDASSADKALQDSHVILGRTVEVKRAVPKSKQYHNRQHLVQQYQHKQQLTREANKTSSYGICNTKKVFVGGLSPSVTNEELGNYFEMFGSITDVAVIHDSITRRSRGFGFVTFDLEESVDNVMLKTFHMLNDRLVEVKRAVPKEENNGGYSSYNARVFPYDSYQLHTYPSYTPSYGIQPGYAYLPRYSGMEVQGYGTDICMVVYPTGGCCGIGYGVASIDPRIRWNGFGTFGDSCYFVPYANTSIFPTYVNGYGGSLEPSVGGKGSQFVTENELMPANVVLSQFERQKLNDDPARLRGSNESASSKQNSSSTHGKLKSCPVDMDLSFLWFTRGKQRQRKMVATKERRGLLFAYP